MTQQKTEVTEIDGIVYLNPPAGAVLTARDGRVSISYGDLPIPLLAEDHQCLDGELPSYDAVGRGMYHALRSNPDCVHGERYAVIIRDAYPHILSELVTHLAMLDKKAVDIAYLDRKIAVLKVLALLQPEDFRIPLEIGRSYLERGTTLSLAHQATTSLFRALEHLERAVTLSPDDAGLQLSLAETCYFLGHYDRAALLWSRVQGDAGTAERERIDLMVQAISMGEYPLVPAVDYLQAAGMAFESHQREEYEEAGAILADILADDRFVTQFPLPQLHCLLADCCQRLGWIEHARDAYNRALAIDPDNREAFDGVACCGEGGRC